MDTTPPPPLVQPIPPTRRPQRVGPILRDVLIVVALTFIGGFVIGLAEPSSSRRMLAIAASNVLFGTVGFAISGCLAVGNRWLHLAYVGLGAWLVGLMNVLFFGLSIVQWLFSIFGVGLMMGVGGAISYVFKRDTNPSA